MKNKIIILIIFIILLVGTLSLVILFTKDELLLKIAGERRKMIGPFIENYSPLECPNNAMGIFYFGQSNSSNTVRPAIVANIPESIVQYDWKTKKCYAYKEPLLGSMDFHSNSATPLMEMLAKTFPNNSIILIPFGVPGSSVLEWAYGGLSHILKDVYRSTRSLNLKTSFTIFIQGEKDSGTPGKTLEIFQKSKHFFHVNSSDLNTNISFEDYRSALNKILNESKNSSGQASYFGIVLASKCVSNPAYLPVRDAQLSLTDKPGVFIAADSDLIPITREYRYNLCRLTPLGANLLSKQLYDSIINILKK